MALPHFVDPNEKQWLLKVTGHTSLNPVRDLCLLHFFFLTPCTTLEINRIQVRDVLFKPGAIKRDFIIRGAPGMSMVAFKYYIKKSNAYT